MNRKANFLVVLAVVSFVWALANDEAAAQAITVTPANPTISVGQTQQFTATGIGTATAVEAGAFHACALLQDGAVRCWGLNDSGQLGDGTRTNSSTPVAVAGIMGAAAVTGGGFHSCVRFPDGTLQCWGRNEFGQLGDPATTTFISATPVRVSGITTATAVTAGAFHTCALLGDGTVRCWGANDFGQLGNGSITVNSPTPTPVAVSGITTAVAISAGGWHTCALLGDGTVRCWGRNDFGQLGNGTTTLSPTPVAVTGITTAVAAETFLFHTCAILRDGTLDCWGRNDEGRLGDGTRTNSSTPVAVAGIITAAVAPGGEHSCALLQGGTVRCWGRNIDGRLGNGTTTDAFTPVTVAGLGGTWTSSDTTVATISATGLATGRGPGSTTITATSGGRSGSTTLTVGTRPSLAVVREGTGSGTVTSSPAGINCGATCSAAYDSGTVVTLTATPAAGSTFEGWTGGGCAGTGPCTVTMTAATTVTATFTRQTFTLTVNRTGTGSGTVTSSPAGINCGATCSAAYDSGTVVTLTATPAFGSIFTGWSGCDTVSGTTCTVTMSAARSVTASFLGIPPLPVPGLGGLL